MILINLIADFFAGVFLCNCIPHLASGLQGAPFPTPFKKPYSSPLINFLWGTFNLIVGLVLLVNDQFILGVGLACFLFYLGFILTGIFLSQYFQKMLRR